MTKHTIIIPTLLITIIIALTIPIGCEDEKESPIIKADPNGLNENGKPVVTQIITNDTGQTTQTIPYDQLTRWLKNNKDKTIHEITPISKAKYPSYGGHTTAFLITHSPANNPNCIHCGQKKPIEKPE